MEYISYVFYGIAILALGYLIWKLHQPATDGDPRLQAELDRRTEEIGELKNQLKELQSKNDELSGNGKQMYDRFKSLEADLKALQKERDGLADRIAKFEAAKAQDQKKHDDAVTKLDAAKAALEDERQRVRQEDEERLAAAEEERDRIWGEHEESVVSQLTDLCKKAQYSFTSFDNNNLPDGFSGKYKPDFMIEFLEQYVVFDAKVSKASNMHTYITEQVKKTAQKVKGNETIYPTIFLVVPTHAIAELKKLSFYEEGFTFYIISPESFEPVLASLKRLETYEFAQEMDPQERENIIDILAHLDFHIATRNAVDYHLLQHGINTLAKVRGLNEDYVKEVMVKREKIRHLNLNTADNKELVGNPAQVEEKLKELTEPTPKLTPDEIDALA